MSGSVIHAAHGMGIKPVAPDWPALMLDEVDRLLRSYAQCGGALALSWHSPRPFSAASLVDTPRGKVFVKRHHRRIRQSAWLAEEHRFIAHLRERGVPVAAVLRNRDGETAIGLGDWTYEVHALAEGQDLYREALSWTPFHSLGHAWAAGRMLARLHGAAADYRAAARQAPVLLANFRLFGQADPLAAVAVAMSRDAGLASYLERRDWQADLAALLQPWHRELLPLLAAQPALWTHNDWHASNLLWSADAPAAEVASVLDFGLSDRTFALFDLATAIERNVVPWLELDAGGRAPAQLEALDALLAGYGSLRPLLGRDLTLLATLLPLVHLDFALSEIGYFQGVVASATNADIAYDHYLLGHSRWFRDSEGQRLLDHLRRLARQLA